MGIVRFADAGLGLLAIGLSLTGGCDSSDSPAGSCTPREAIACLSADGCSGYKTCQSNRTYGACVCGAATGGSAGGANQTSVGAIGGASANGGTPETASGGRMSGAGGSGDIDAAGGVQARGGTTTGEGASSGVASGGVNVSGGGVPATGGTAAGVGASPTAGSKATGGRTNQGTGGVATGGRAAGGAGGLGGSSAAVRCANPSGDLVVTHTTSSSEPGGTTVVTAASELTIAVSEVEIRFCFGIQSAASPTITSGALRIDIASVSLATTPYFVQIGRSTPIFVESATASDFCMLMDLASVTALAGANMSGTDKISISWALVTTALGGAALDPSRPVEIVVSRQGVTAACTPAAL